MRYVIIIFTTLLSCNTNVRQEESIPIKKKEDTLKIAKEFNEFCYFCDILKGSYVLSSLRAFCLDIIEIELKYENRKSFRI